jgi:drug/metabolite transporter (DMT)-like permease
VFWSFAAIYVIWGSTYLGIRIVVEAFPPFLAGGVRFLVAGWALYAWARWRGVPAPALRIWRPAFVLGGLFFLVGNGGISWAETRIPSGLTALLAATSPLFTVVFESSRARWERPAPRVVLGILAGLSGVALLVARETIGAATPTNGRRGYHRRGDGVGVRLGTRMPCRASPVLYRNEMIGGGTLLLLTAWPREGAASTRICSPSRRWRHDHLIVLGSIIGFSAFTCLAGIHRQGRDFAYVNGLVAVLLGWALLGEDVSPDPPGCGGDHRWGGADPLAGGGAELGS